jgi:hypothetical protein
MPANAAEDPPARSIQKARLMPLRSRLLAGFSSTGKIAAEKHTRLKFWIGVMFHEFCFRVF